MSIYKIRTNFGTHFKYILLGVAFIFVVGAVFTFAGMPTGDGGEQEEVAKDVVATVNGIPITRNEYDSQWQQMSEQLRDSGYRSTLQFAQQRASLFQSMVESRVILISAEAVGVDISKKQIAAKRDAMIVDYLKQNRSKVLGKLSTEQDKLDPRKDKAYKSELAKGGMSLTLLERQAGLLIPEGQVTVQLAQEGFQKAIESKVGAVTKDDIKKSFDVFQLRQITMFNDGSPTQQFKTQVDKVAAEAKTGDFVELAKKYGKDPDQGAVRSASYGMLAQEVWDQLTKLKPGQVTGPIEVNQAVYIVKLESVKSEYPEKMEKKDEDQRRDMIKNMRMMQEYLKYDKQVKANLKVVVTNPELSGYWHITQAQQATSEAEAKKQISLARSSFEKAIGLEPNNNYATAMLAVVLNQQEKTKEATQLLYQLLEGKDSQAVGYDLRIMLGDLLNKAGKKDEAVKQFEKGVDEAGFDVSAHQQIMAKFKEVGREDLAAEQQKWIDDYETKKKQYEAQQENKQPTQEGGQ